MVISEIHQLHYDVTIMGRCTTSFGDDQSSPIEGTAGGKFTPLMIIFFPIGCNTDDADDATNYFTLGFINGTYPEET